MAACIKEMPRKHREEWDTVLATAHALHTFIFMPNKQASAITTDLSADGDAAGLTTILFTHVVSHWLLERKQRLILAASVPSWRMIAG